MNDIEVTQLLHQMRAMAAQAQGVPAQEAAAVDGANFGAMLTEAVNGVNALQKQSSTITKAFEQGDPSVALSDVMVASQKSSIAFEATLQVRNRLVEAYQTVMRMPI